MDPRAREELYRRVHASARRRTEEEVEEVEEVHGRGGGQKGRGADKVANEEEEEEGHCDHQGDGVGEGSTIASNGEEHQQRQEIIAADHCNEMKLKESSSVESTLVKQGDASRMAKCPCGKDTDEVDKTKEEGNIPYGNSGKMLTKEDICYHEPTDKIQREQKTDFGKQTVKHGRGEGIQTGGDPTDPNDLLQMFRNEVNPLPNGSDQQPIIPRHQICPGAFPVASPFRRQGPSRVETSETTLMTESSVSSFPNTNSLVNVLASLSPQEEGGNNNNTDVAGETVAVCKQRNNSKDDICLEAKIVTDNGDHKDFSSTTTRIVIFVLVLILIAVVITMSLGLAGRLRLLTRENNDDEQHSSLLDEEEISHHAESSNFSASQNNESAVSFLGSQKPLFLLEEILQRGYLKCHYANIPNFMSKDETTGKVTGFHSAWCKAVAAALFGLNDLDSRIQYVDLYPLNMDVDVSAIGISSTMSRRLNLAFTAPILYDGIRFGGDPFYVECAQDFKHLDECNDLMVCVQSPSTHYTFMESVLPVRRMVTFSELEDTMKGFLKGDCNVLVTKQVYSPEAVLRAWGYQGNFTLGDKIFTHDPWSIVTPKGNPCFTDFVNAVVQSILVAEQHNITQANGHLFPQTKVFGERHKNMFRQAVSAVGNLQEIHKRYLSHTFERKPVNQINDGSSGLMLSHPFGLSHIPPEAGYAVGPHLEEVLSRGKLVCGVQYNRPGFAMIEMSSESSTISTSTGMDIDACKGLAASLFGSVDALELVPMNSVGDGFQHLVNKNVDVFAGAMWNLDDTVQEENTGNNFAFSQPYFYGEGEENLCLATLEDDSDWATFVSWFITATIYAEEQGINQTTSNEMPLISVFGSELQRMGRDAILAVGSYGELYQRNLESLIPRSGRNLLNINAEGPQHYPMPGLVQST